MSNNGNAVIKERVNNLIREVRESNTQQNGRMEKIEKMFETHIQLCQDLVGKCETRITKIEYAHEGNLAHGLTGLIIRMFKGR